MAAWMLWFNATKDASEIKTNALHLPESCEVEITSAALCYLYLIADTFVFIAKLERLTIPVRDRHTVPYRWNLLGNLCYHSDLSAKITTLFNYYLRRIATLSI
jgi:hypothetical protein